MRKLRLDVCLLSHCINQLFFFLSFENKSLCSPIGTFYIDQASLEPGDLLASATQVCTLTPGAVTFSRYCDGAHDRSSSRFGGFWFIGEEKAQLQKGLHQGARATAFPYMVAIRE